MFVNTLLTLFFSLFLVVFISAKPECKLFFTHALVCYNDEKKKRDDKHKVGKKLILIWSYFVCGL